MACKGCEVLPRLPEHGGILYLAAQVPHTLIHLADCADRLGLRAERLPGDVLAVTMPAGRLGEWLEPVADGLSEPELDSTRALFLQEGEGFEPALLRAVQSLGVLAGLHGGAWLSAMIEEERLTSFFHPIVHTQDPHRIFAHECLLRGHDPQGAMVFPDRLFPAAKASGTLFHLDRAARITAIRQSVAHQLPGNIFINFNPTAIYDPTFCLQTTLREVEQAGLDPQRVVFEVVESEEIADQNHLQRILAFYREHGFRVALDDLGAGYGSLGLLERLRPDFVKVDRALISGVDADPYKARILASLIDLADGLDVGMVAEGVETEAEWHWLRERGVDYCQGFYFCRPGSPPPAIENPVA